MLWRLSALWRWIRGLRHRDYRAFWFALLVIVVSGAVVFCLGSERSFRLTGLALQLIGIMTVALTIRDTRERFDRPGILARAAQYLRQFPRMKSAPSVISASVAIALGTASATARAEVWHNASPGDDLDKRLNVMEKNLSRVKERLNEFEQETGKNLAQQVNAINQEKQIRTDDDKDIRQKLEGLAVGSLRISAVGVFCLLLGVIMSTTSPEWAELWAHHDEQASQIET